MFCFSANASDISSSSLLIVWLYSNSVVLHLFTVVENYELSLSFSRWAILSWSTILAMLLLASFPYEVKRFRISTFYLVTLSVIRTDLDCLLMDYFIREASEIEEKTDCKFYTIVSLNLSVYFFNAASLI